MDRKLAGSNKDDQEETVDNDLASENGSAQSEQDERKVAAVTSTSSSQKRTSSSAEGSDADPESHDDGKKRMRTSADGSVAVNLDKVSHEQRWGEMYKRLVEYKNKNGESNRYTLYCCPPELAGCSSLSHSSLISSSGHCLVPNRYVEDSQVRLINATRTLLPAEGLSLTIPVCCWRFTKSWDSGVSRCSYGPRCQPVASPRSLDIPFSL
jgi:hypothetical protein